MHGKRRIKKDKLADFQESYQAFSRSAFATCGIKAAFAFADVDESFTFWHVLWAKNVAAFEAARSRDAQLNMRLQSTYESTPEDPDTVHVYGAWDDAIQQADPSVRFRVHRPMAGFIKQDGAGESGPPLIGFTKRYILPGRADNLAASFQTVCDLWRKKVPGILAASVSRDDDEPNLVHDIRIFANHAAYQAHVNKEDTVLTASMQEWFANYDTNMPFTGELYMPGASTKDDGIRTSSIKDRPVRTGFSEFVYGQGMLGPMPDMTKDDEMLEL